MRKFIFYAALVVAFLSGLAAIMAGIWLAIGNPTNCDCTRTAQIGYGIGQSLTGILLIGGSLAAIRRRYNSAWLSWFFGSIAVGFLFFWIWPLALLVILILMAGNYVMLTTPEVKKLW